MDLIQVDGSDPSLWIQSEWMNVIHVNGFIFSGWIESKLMHLTQADGSDMILCIDQMSTDQMVFDQKL